MGIYKNCNTHRPCPICGYTDWCSYVLLDGGEELQYCHRKDGNKGEIVYGIDGRSYVYKRQTEEGFSVFEEKNQYEKNLKLYLNSKGKSFDGGNYRKQNTISNSSSTNEVEGIVPVESPARLNIVYRAFLQLLILEKKHENRLRMEWDSLPNEQIFDKICKNWGIKSLPPQDALRFSSKEQLENKSRKAIMEELVKKVGEPKGVPGFYQRKDGRWTVYDYLSGIIYPVFDSHNNIVRLRIADDYPKVEGNFNGKEGIFRYLRETEKVGPTGWYFIDEMKNPTFVWGYGRSDNKIQLNQKGLPNGKVVGKYKNLTSTIIKNEDGKQKNILLNGSYSGSHISLYMKPGDNMSVVYVTEGEKKAMVANLMLNCPCISLPGVASFSKLFNNEEGYSTSIMEELRKLGMELAVLVYDSDKNNNISVLKFEKNAVKKFLDEGYKLAIGEWNPAWGKGLDDVLLAGVKPKIYPIA